ncbi:MAG: HD domain-containing protein [Clostridiales bacterium]|jgi:putative nucleotidyltransferase with HDIG domain|nr:HD domain-containing protein [Clostridiales bacterium]
MVTFEDIKINEEINVYIRKADEILGVLGYTDHSIKHTLRVGYIASKILQELEFPEREQELSKIAAYLHDIGNIVNRSNHANTGAVLAFTVLNRIGMDPGEISIITSAIGNHDEGTGVAVSPVSAAIIIGDKTDVRRSRVRNRDFTTFDIHDRVNYSVVKSDLTIRAPEKIIALNLVIDTSICSVLDYFEIFLSRMLMCKRAAEFLGTNFELVINNIKLL